MDDYLFKLESFVFSHPSITSGRFSVLKCDNEDTRCDNENTFSSSVVHSIVVRHIQPVIEGAQQPNWLHNFVITQDSRVYVSCYVNNRKSNQNYASRVVYLPDDVNYIKYEDLDVYDKYECKTSGDKYTPEVVDGFITMLKVNEQTIRLCDEDDGCKLSD